MAKLDEIAWYINQLSYDLKAEQLLAFFEDNIKLREIIASHEGQLQRVWSKDVAGATVDSLPNGREILNVRLNRDGIYDALPESLFHDLTDSNCSSGAEMAKESMRLRTEEKESRLFFKPLENEIFLQKVQLADMENRLFESIYTEKLMGLISDFWKLDDKLPKVYISRLTRLLPFAHLISGNKNLTDLCLEFIIDENVELEEQYLSNSDSLSDFVSTKGKLGECDLGADSILGEYVNGYISGYCFKIGPIKNPATSLFVKNGTMDRFLKCFYNYFIPVYIDPEAEFVLEYEHSFLVLDSDNELNVSYLGYNSIIE